MLSRRVLLVEDSPEIRGLTARVLRDSGFEVAEVVDGTEALQFLAEHEPDLIILDLMLPGANGYQILEGAPHPPAPFSIADHHHHGHDDRAGAVPGDRRGHGPAEAVRAACDSWRCSPGARAA